MKRINFKWNQKDSEMLNLKNLYKQFNPTQDEFLNWYKSNFGSKSSGIAKIRAIYECASNKQYLWDDSISIIANLRFLEAKRQFPMCDTIGDIADELIEKFGWLNRGKLIAVLNEMF